MLLVVELGQGTIGYVQYVTDVPVALVAAHIVGAAALIATGTWMLLAVVSATQSALTPQTSGRHPA